MGGHVDVVRELLALTGDRRVDVHVDDEGGFRGACLRGHLGVVRELLALTGDRRVDVHALFVEYPAHVTECPTGAIMRMAVAAM